LSSNNNDDDDDDDGDDGPMSSKDAAKVKEEPKPEEKVELRKRRRRIPMPTFQKLPPSMRVVPRCVLGWCVANPLKAPTLYWDGEEENDREKIVVMRIIIIIRRRRRLLVGTMQATRTRMITTMMRMRMIPMPIFPKLPRWMHEASHCVPVLCAANPLTEPSHWDSQHVRLRSAEENERREETSNHQSARTMKRMRRKKKKKKKMRQHHHPLIANRMRFAPPTRMTTIAAAAVVVVVTVTVTIVARNGNMKPNDPCMRNDREWSEAIPVRATMCCRHLRADQQTSVVANDRPVLLGPIIVLLNRPWPLPRMDIRQRLVRWRLLLLLLLPKTPKLELSGKKEAAPVNLPAMEENQLLHPHPPCHHHLLNHARNGKSPNQPKNHSSWYKIMMSYRPTLNVRLRCEAIRWKRMKLKAPWSVVAVEVVVVVARSQRNAKAVSETFEEEEEVAIAIAAPDRSSRYQSSCLVHLH